MSICTRCPLLVLRWSSRCMHSPTSDLHAKFRSTLRCNQQCSTLYTSGNPRECYRNELAVTECSKHYDLFKERIPSPRVQMENDKQLSELRGNYKTSTPHFALPTDMSSRVFQLYMMQRGAATDCDPLPFAPIERTTNGSNTLYALEELLIRVLQTCSTENWSQKPQETSLHLTSQEKVKKDVEPADDPKQKMRKLEVKLRKQLPMFLNSGSAWHDFSIYTPNVQLCITPQRYSRKHSFRGLPIYRRIAKIFRFACRFCLHEAKLEVLSLMSHEDKKIFEIRWRVVGVPYYLQLLSYLSPLSRRRFIKYYDYMSTLSLTEDAKVWRHNIDKMRPAPSLLLRGLAGLRKNARAAAAITPFVRKDTT